MAEKSKDTDGAENSPKSPELETSQVETLPQVEAGEETDPLLPTTVEEELALDTATGQGSPALGQGPPGPPGPAEQVAPVTMATATVLSALTTAELASTCSQLVESLLSQVVLCSERGEHGLGESTSCSSITCTLGGGAPLEDLSSAVALLVSENQRFVRRTHFNCPKCKSNLCHTSHCPCGESINLPQTLFRKAFARSMSILGKTQMIAKSRPAPTTRTAVTLHRWASYILLAHGVGYMGLLTDATSVHMNIACPCFGVQPAQIDLLKGINKTAATRVRQREVGITINL